MRSVKRVAAVSGECARSRRVCAMWVLDVDISFGRCRNYL